MRILIVSGVYPPDIGGPSLQVRQIAEGLRARGHEVRVVVPRDRGETERDAFVEVLELPRGGGWRKVWRQVALARGLWRSFARFRPDVAHVQVFGGLTCAFAGLIARVRGVPALVKLTGERAFERAGEQRGEAGATDQPPAWSDRATLALFSRVWATTPIFAERLRRAYHRPPESISVLPNFVDLSAYLAIGRDPARDEPARILTVCRLRPWKGLETAARALAQLDRPFVWTLVGDGDPAYEQRLDALLAELGLAQRTRRVGKCPPTEVGRHYAAADVFLLLSDYEPFGIVFAEAMAAGLPVVATRTGGIPFVTNGAECARLVPPGDAAAAAHALGELLGDPAAGKRFAAAGRARAARCFDLAAGITALEQTYGSLCAGGRGLVPAAA